MAFPNDNLTEDNVFLDPSTEKVSDAWGVFKKMKDAIKALIASRGTANGIAPLDANSKIPSALIPPVANRSITLSMLTKGTANKIIGFNASGNPAELTPYEPPKPLPLSTEIIASGQLTLIGIWTKSASVDLESGTYLLVPVGGDASVSVYNSININTFTGKAGGTSTITLDGFNAVGSGGGAPSLYTVFDNDGNYQLWTTPGTASTSITPFGGSGAGGLPQPGKLPISLIPNIAGFTAPIQIKTTISKATATIVVGVGGASSKPADLTNAPPGKNGWCAIWKIG